MTLLRSLGLVLVGALAAVAGLRLTQTPGSAPVLAPSPGQFPPVYRPARAADGRPDFNGIWQAISTANWNIQDHAASSGFLSAQAGVYGAEPAGLGIVEGGDIPYQAWALEKRNALVEKRLTPDPRTQGIGDPEAKCYMPGLPRATYMPFPFQIVQGTDTLLFVYEFADVGRVVYLKPMPPPEVDSWMGQSVARFDGDVLEITATGFNDQTWFDRAGNFHSEQLKVVERFTAVSPYHLRYEATIEDPKVFTRPWKVALPLYRRMDEGARILEFKCVEFSEAFLYGSLVRPAGR
jgi:hypothetical protein